MALCSRKNSDQKDVFNCKEITVHPVLYSIKDDKVYYAKDNYFNIQNYKRTSTVKASKDIVLYSGAAHQLTPHNKSKLKQYPFNIRFVLLKDLEIIRGGWQVANCKGLLIGAREK